MIALGQLAKPGDIGKLAYPGIRREALARIRSEGGDVDLVTAERRTWVRWFGHTRIVLLLCLDLCHPNDLVPFLRFIVHELAELGV